MLSPFHPAAAVIVAGGMSRRMGRPKAFLPWRGGTLLDHVVSVARLAGAEPIVVAGPADGTLGQVDADLVVRDPVLGQGPLRGIATGLAAASELGADLAIVLAVDLPLLQPAYLRRVVSLLDDQWEVALPTVGGHHQPMAAAYRTSLADRAIQVLDSGREGIRGLLDVARVRELTEQDLLDDDDLAAADPELHSVFNANSPADFARALTLSQLREG